MDRRTQLRRRHALAQNTARASRHLTAPLPCGCCDGVRIETHGQAAWAVGRMCERHSELSHLHPGLTWEEVIERWP